MAQNNKMLKGKTGASKWAHFDYDGIFGIRYRSSFWYISAFSKAIDQAIENPDVFKRIASEYDSIQKISRFGRFLCWVFNIKNYRQNAYILAFCAKASPEQCVTASSISSSDYYKRAQRAIKTVEKHIPLYARPRRKTSPDSNVPQIDLPPTLGTHPKSEVGAASSSMKNPSPVSVPLQDEPLSVTPPAAVKNGVIGGGAVDSNSPSSDGSSDNGLNKSAQSLPRFSMSTAPKPTAKPRARMGDRSALSTIDDSTIIVVSSAEFIAALTDMGCTSLKEGGITAGEIKGAFLNCPHSTKREAVMKHVRPLLKNHKTISLTIDNAQAIRETNDAMKADDQQTSAELDKLTEGVALLVAKRKKKGVAQTESTTTRRPGPG